IRIVRAYVTSLPVVLPPFAPGGGRHASEPVVDVNLDHVGRDLGAQMLRAHRLDADPIAIFIGQAGKHQIALGAAEIVGPEGSVVERKGLSGRYCLRAGSVGHGHATGTSNVVLRVNGPLAAPLPLQLVAPQ